MTTPRSTKLARVKERLFKDIPTIDIKQGLFVPMPMLFRLVMYKFLPREWQVLSWIYLNCRKESVCSFSLDELSSGVAFKSKPKLRAMLRKLEKEFWIVRKEERGTEYYLARDVRDAIRLNVEAKLLSEADLGEVNEFLELMKREPIQAALKSKKGGA